MFSVDLTNHKNITGKLFLQSYYRHFLREKIDFDSISCSAISRENDKLSPWPFLFTNTAWSSRFYRNIQNGVVSQWTRITRPFNEVLSGLSFVGFRLPFVFVHIKKLRHEWKRVAKVTTTEDFGLRLTRLSFILIYLTSFYCRLRREDGVTLFLVVFLWHWGTKFVIYFYFTNHLISEKNSKYY